MQCVCGCPRYTPTAIDSDNAVEHTAELFGKLGVTEATKTLCMQNAAWLYRILKGESSVPNTCGNSSPLKTVYGRGGGQNHIG
ncbi:hypothetical protein BV898_00841 [Hypsibius exemplaris]|uniref:Uncharacterized protein n=1 Tax=Hypsibius exemplaris TaxID=2072580 RepID=A0A1W0XCY6_HYPEX|nr:hypothetical protein BV898_00841 [Hypsibius exemplaris]